MFSWIRRLVRRDRPEIHIVRHLEPWAWKPFDLLQYLDAPIHTIGEVPFDKGATKEAVETYDPKRHFTMNGAVPDLIHRFMRTNGIPIEFYFREGRLLQINDNATAYRHGRLSL